MPNWTKVRANLDPQAGSGFVYLDQDALGGVGPAGPPGPAATLGPWENCTMLNGSSGEAKVQKDSNGIVYLRMGVYGAADWPNELVELPFGYHPIGRIWLPFVNMDSYGNFHTDNVICINDADTNGGNIEVISDEVSIIRSHSYHSLTFSWPTVA